MQINYSIIIPHYNIPDLLERCLESIPERKDLQIIIVDDNSNPELVDFMHFPGIGRENTEMYFTKEGKGAGYARNVGLEHARGKWVLFADADDFYHDCFPEFIDKYRDTDYDIIYFMADSVYSDSMEKAGFRYQKLKKNIVRAIDKGQEDRLRFTSLVPWGKMIRKDLIDRYHIRFDEVRASNDVMFSVKCGYYASKITYSLEEIYCATIREGSLAYAYTREILNARMFVCYELNHFLESVGQARYRMNTIDLWLGFRHFGFRCFRQEGYKLFRKEQKRYLILDLWHYWGRKFIACFSVSDKRQRVKCMKNESF